MPENTTGKSGGTDPGAQKPGTLRSQVTMEIQTSRAQRLVNGRKRSEGVEPILGAIDFGRRTRALWQSAGNDDPYADWTLLKMEDFIHAAKQMIESHSRRIGEILAGMEGFNIEIANSVEPIQVSLQFGNPYGYMGAYLVADFDMLARTALTARHLGLIDRLQSEEILHAAERAIRRIFNYTAEWRFTGVDREDFRQMNQNARRASEWMGELPPEVLSGEKRARMAPPIRLRPNHAPFDPAGDADETGSDGIEITGEETDAFGAPLPGMVQQAQRPGDECVDLFRTEIEGS
ncbi:MAG: TIGR03761 family integrating conjugative element protein [Methylococcaceae bacterium]|nr:TIGR03761 family integrating conjugative element protein [Methylococcaceae bacterium]